MQKKVSRSCITSVVIKIFLVLIMFARSILKIQINGTVLLKLDVLQLI